VFFTLPSLKSEDSRYHPIKNIIVTMTSLLTPYFS